MEPVPGANLSHGKRRLLNRSGTPRNPELHPARKTRIAYFGSTFLIITSTAFSNC